MAEVTFEGQTFEVKDGKLNQLVWAEFFSFASDEGDDAQLPHSVLVALIEDCIAPKHLGRFKRLGYKTDDFFDKALEVLLPARMKTAEGEHPTGLPAVSTDGQDETPAKSDASYDAKVFEMVHGRPDLYALQMERLERAAG